MFQKIKFQIKLLKKYLGYLYIKDKQWSNATGILSEINDKDPLLLFKKGYALEKLKKNQDALIYYKQAIALKPRKHTWIKKYIDCICW